MRPARSALRALSLAVSLVSVACGSTSDEDETGEPVSPDACGIETGYEGDENCIVPPAEDEGVQLYMGPGAAAYDDPEVMSAQDAEGNSLWIMLPGDERTQCYHLTAPNAETRWYFEQQYRMRPGSHHMIIQNSTNTDPVDGWARCSGGIVGSIGGTQHVIEDLPPGGVVAPEDEGLARELKARQPLDVQLHFYNTTDRPRLREAWVNFLYKPADEVTTNLGMLGGFVLPMNVPPNTTTTVGSVCRADQAIGATTSPRIVTLFGHAHTHNQRFAVHHDKADGSSETVYDSYDGAEAPTYTYNTVVENPVADPVNRMSGGKSGPLVLQPGEQLRFECDIVNDTELTFVGKNEVNTDEMCNLFGSVAGLGFPCFNLNR